MNLELVLIVAIAVTTLVTAITSYRLSTSDVSGDRKRQNRVKRIFYIELSIAFILTICLYLASEVQKGRDKKDSEEFISRKIEGLNRQLGSLGLSITASNKIAIFDTLKLLSFYTSATINGTTSGGIVSPSPIAAIAGDSTIIYQEELTDEELTASECRTHGINMNSCFGRFKIVNKFTEPILLYEVSNGSGRTRCSMMISPGGINTTPLIRAGYHNNDKCEPGAEEHKFYFRTVNSSVVKYGEISMSTHACKIRTKVISPNNFYLAIDGEKSSN